MSPGLPRALAVFDLCDTLYAENTTLGFVRFFHARAGHRRTGRALDLLHSRRLPAFYAIAALERLLARDLLRDAALRTLAGQSRGALAEMAQAYASEVLPARMVPRTQARLAAHREVGDRVMIVSSSLDLVVEAVAERLGVEWRASRLAWRHGRCTGRLAEDLTGRKARVVAAQAAGARLHVYTDNLSDRDLLAEADHPTIVVPAGRTRAAWGRTEASFLEL